MKEAIEKVVNPTDMDETAEILTEAAVARCKPKEEPTDEKPYTFRTLGAPDVFLMFKIISTIGINEFTACFEKDGILKLINKMTCGDNGEDDGEDDGIASIVGFSVGLEIANIILGNLPECEKEIFQILSQTSNLTEKQVRALDMLTFFEIVIDFIKKDEFKDFIKVVSKLFK